MERTYGDLWKTKDLYEASYIYSQNIPLIGLEGTTKQFFFVFDECHKCVILSQDYWAQKAEGNIKAYANSIRTLKDLVFSKKG